MADYYTTMQDGERDPASLTFASTRITKTSQNAARREQQQRAQLSTTTTTTYDDALSTEKVVTAPTTLDDGCNYQHYNSKNELTAVRFALSLLLAMLVMAALTTLVAVRQYRLIVAIFWGIIIVAYICLAQLLQYALTQQQRDSSKVDILPPVVRRMVRAVVTEWDNFEQDWRDHVLLQLKNAPEEGDLGHSNDYTAFPNDETQNHINADASAAPKKTRSRIFRVLVQPWVPLIRRRRQQRKQRSHHGRNNDNADDGAV